MKTVSKGKLKARMLEYFREVEQSGEPLIVTDHGREVLEVRPFASRALVTAEDVLTWYRAGTSPRPEVSEEELVEPLPLEDWEVLREDDRNPW
jgi:antitoxin (DNA-binding transcriptional repressor) of toxin-antitoxin stability system